MNRYTRPDNSPAWMLRSEPAPEELHDMRQPPVLLSLQDLTVIVSAMILAVTACLILGLAVLRADRPAVCRAHDLSGAECAAAVAEGSSQ